MGTRPFVLVLDRCHRDNAYCDLHVVSHGGYANGLGMLSWAQDRMLRGAEYNAPRAQEGGGS